MKNVYIVLNRTYSEDFKTSHDSREYFTSLKKAIDHVRLMLMAYDSELISIVSDTLGYTDIKHTPITCNIDFKDWVGKKQYYSIKKESVN